MFNPMNAHDAWKPRQDRTSLFDDPLKVSPCKTCQLPKKELASECRKQPECPLYLKNDVSCFIEKSKQRYNQRIHKTQRKPCVYEGCSRKAANPEPYRLCWKHRTTVLKRIKNGVPKDFLFKAGRLHKVKW